MTELERALAEAAAIFDQENIPYMVIGGVAVIIWGNTRATIDIDVTVWVEEDALEPTIMRLSQRLLARVDDPCAFTKRTRVLPVKATSGVPIDIIFATLPFERQAIEDAEEKTLGESRVRVCRVSDLIVHKILSERPRDREDVRFLITRYADSLDRSVLDTHVESLARELSRSAILDFYRSCWP